MQLKWYKPLLEKIYDSYSARIIVIDTCKYSLYPEVQEALEKDFDVHYYNTELELRSFFNKSGGSRSIIIKLPDVSYLPFDIEQGSDIIYWRKADLDPVSPDKDKEKEKGKEKGAFLSEFYNSASELERLLAKDSVLWGKAGYLWGRLSFLKDRLLTTTIYNNEASTPEIEKLVENLEPALEEKFTKFIFHHYRNLFYKSIYHEPVTVDKVMPFLTHQKQSKLALICMDGMGFQEWFCLKEHLNKKGISSFNEKHVFALLPTVTEFSRRALFSGKKLLAELPAENKGFLEYVNHYMASDRDDAMFFLEQHPQMKTEYFSNKCVGIIYRFIDELAHQTHIISEDKVLMQQNLEVVLRKTKIDEVVKRFLNEGYKVIFTSDHGSVFSQGIGVKQDKYLLDKRAKRACLFNNKRLAEDFIKNKEGLFLYTNEELLGDSCAVFAPWRGMFGKEGERQITHGGIHLEEVVIPFVEVLT